MNNVCIIVANCFYTKITLSWALKQFVTRVHTLFSIYSTCHSQRAKFMAQTWGPAGSCRPQLDPMSAPWTLLLAFLPPSSLQLALESTAWTPLRIPHAQPTQMITIQPYVTRFSTILSRTVRRFGITMKIKLHAINHTIPNSSVSFWQLGPLLLTWSNFNPSMDK